MTAFMAFIARCNAFKPYAHKIVGTKVKSVSSLSMSEPASEQTDTITPEIEPLVDASAGRSDEIPYDWQNKWYAVTYDKDFDCGEAVIPYSIFGMPLALWRDKEGNINCVEDRCSHRAAKLSEGRLRDGKLECRYHGWQFGKDGSCTHIPQLREGASIPKAACISHFEVQVREGIVWVYATPIMKAKLPLPPIPVTPMDLDLPESKDYDVYNFQCDLPYDHSYLIENLLDPAHIPVSHDRTNGGGKIENAQPIEMKIDYESMDANGFTGVIRNARGRCST